MTSEETLLVYQIYFSNASLKRCMSWTQKYNNTNRLTPFFENSPIRDLLERGEHNKAKYFGVWSYDFPHGGNLGGNFRKEQLSPNSPDVLVNLLNEYKPEVLTFSRNAANFDHIALGENYHKGFYSAFWNIMQAIGYVDKPLGGVSSTLYSNHFVATPQWWEGYLNKVLAPAMDYMQSDAEVIIEFKQGGRYKGPINKFLMQNSGYWKSAHSQQLRDSLKKQIGVGHFPYHTFVVERMPSVYNDVEGYPPALSWTNKQR